MLNLNENFNDRHVGASRQVLQPHFGGPGGGFGAER